MSTKRKTKKQSTNNNNKKTNSSPKKTTKNNDFLWREISIIVFIALGIFLMLSYFGLCGPIGDGASKIMFGIFGITAYITPILISIIVGFVLSNKGNTKVYIKCGAGVILYIMTCTIIQSFIFKEAQSFAGVYKTCASKKGGGVLGALLLKLLYPALKMPGTYIFIIVFVLISIVILTEKSLVGAVKHKGEEIYNSAKEGAARRREETEQVVEEDEDSTEETITPAKEKKKKRIEKVVSGVSFDTTLEKKDQDVRELEPPLESEDDLFDTESDHLVIDRGTPVADEDDFVESPRPETTRKPRSTKESRESAEKEATSVDIEIKKQEEKPKKAYKYPPMSLLTKGTPASGDSDAYLRETARKLEQTLRNFNVNVTVTNISCGPSVTRYELQPEMGVKVSKIVGLANDIKLNLAASDIRIEAPIPGKAAVGIEVPNETKVAVRLRDVLESDDFHLHKSKLASAIGKDIGGKVIVADIAKMPHVLIAGTTGSGKSVCVNSIIMSILYKAKPDEVKFIMIDPKQVEMKVYNGIPHLLIPVVTDPKKAAGALNWAVAEMSRRYQLFAECNVRDIKTYNERIDSIADIEGDSKPEKLPQIVIVVDEFADLMMVSPGEVEDAVCRLAQLARACGIHLVLATQRPSVNVITGLIKANMPSRIALTVSSGVDSRTIIDMNGAEKLLGNGDMLFYPSGYPTPARVQGTYVSDEEVQAVTQFLINNANGTAYNTEVEQQINAANSGTVAINGGMNHADERDMYFAEAGRFVIEKEKASIGMLQRVFKIGFNRAARIMDQLADAGVVGEEEGTKPRKVLMTMEEFEQYIEESL